MSETSEQNFEEILNKYC